ncbi:aldo/keto reductase [uncultured Amnibacterium sp.]|uniref:aldo/keto reductase n=1 Tax=uncultured Amnibacterium sp. TaxID=1631851 RepID=UPI0035CAEDDE
MQYADEPESLPPDALRPRRSRASVIDAALAVVRNAEQALADQDTRELLDEAAPPFRYRRIGDTALAVHPVILGTGAFAAQDSDRDVRSLLDQYAAAGGNAVDVSSSDPRAPELVGRWLRERKLRDRTVLLARVGAHAEGGLSAAALRSAVDGMRTRMGVDTIDLLTLHHDDRTTPLEETLTAADALVVSGAVRYLAAGDYALDRLIEARITAAQHGLTVFVAAEPRYNLLRRVDYERRVAPMLLAQHLSALPRSPLAGGLLADLVVTRAQMRRLRDLDPARAERIAAGGGRRGARVLAAVRTIARRRREASATIALAWLATRPGVIAPITSVTSQTDVAQVLAAAGVHLTRAEVQALDRAST